MVGADTTWTFTLDDPSSVELQRSLSWVFWKLFLVVDWVKKDSCSLLLRIYQGAWSLIPDPGHQVSGSNATRTQGLAPWSMIQAPGDRCSSSRMIWVPGSRHHEPWTRHRSTMIHEPCTVLLGTRYQDPGTMNHDPGSTGRAPMPPRPPLYVVRLPRAKG